jgi:hypothetical protein
VSDRSIVEIFPDVREDPGHTCDFGEHCFHYEERPCGVLEFEEILDERYDLDYAPVVITSLLDSVEGMEEAGAFLREWTRKVGLENARQIDELLVKRFLGEYGPRARLTMQQHPDGRVSWIVEDVRGGIGAAAP